MTTASTQITLAALRFLQPTASPDAPSRWWLLPDGRRLRDSDFGAALDAMPKPLLVSAQVEKGGVTASPIASSAPEARGWLQHEWRNQSAFLDAKLAIAGASSDAPVAVLLEVEDETIVVSTADVGIWVREYVLTSCGWTVEDSGGDTRAPLRMLFRRPDGTWSPGMACRLRAPAT